MTHTEDGVSLSRRLQRMRNRFGRSTLVIGALGAILAGSLFVLAGQVQAPAASRIKRQANGKPDFSGFWQANNTANWDLLTHDALPARVMQTGVHALSPVPAEGAGCRFRPRFPSRAECLRYTRRKLSAGWPSMSCR